jgi:hypothetical protein
MAVNKAWLRNVRESNRKGMGMGGLGSMGATGLQAAFNKPPPVSTDDRVAAPLAPLYVPEAPQIPKSVLYVGGAVLLGLFGLTVYSVMGRK